MACARRCGQLVLLGLALLAVGACGEAADPGGPDAFAPDPVTVGRALPSVLPVLRIDVAGQAIERDVEIAGQLQVFERHDGTLTDLDALTPTLTSPISFQGRGNFTWSLPKKGYAFELQDGVGGEQDQELLGMPAGSDFALYACYTDKTCLRYALVFALGQRFGRWSPRTRYVELFIDGDYQGLYMVMERIRRDATRVVLPKPADTAALGDVSGGYIVRHEGGGKGSSDGVARDFATTRGIVYTYHYPNETKISAEQSAYVRAAFQTLEDQLAATPASYAQWIDELSWVDQGIAEEVTNNWDGYVHSVYMTKEADADGGRIGMGPVWDFDLAFANGDVTGYNCMTNTWAYRNVRGAPDDVPGYWLALYAEPAFQTAFKCRYQALRQDALSLQTIDAQIGAWTAFTRTARTRDQARWPTLGQEIRPNCFSHPTYEAEVQALRDWIAERLSWLDSQVATFPGDCP